MLLADKSPWGGLIEVGLICKNYFLGGGLFEELWYRCRGTEGIREVKNPPCGARLGKSLNKRALMQIAPAQNESLGGQLEFKRVLFFGSNYFWL